MSVPDAVNARLRAVLQRPWFLLAAPLLLAFSAYARVLAGGFEFDDDVEIATNTAVKDLGGFLGGRFLDGFWNGGRPVTDLTFAINYAMGGLHPWSYHLVSIALHLGTVVLAWALVRELLRLAGASAEWVALGVAAAFALHPIQTQAVSYVVQRSEVLASGLYLGSLLLVLAAERRGLTERAWGLLAGAWLLFVLALGSKAIAVTMPVAWMLGVAVLPSPQAATELAPWRRRLLVAVPFVGAGALHAWRMMASAAASTEVGFAVSGLTWWTYLLTQLRVVATYVRLLFLPVGQNVDWDFPPSSSLVEPAVIFCGLFLLAVVGGAVWLAAVVGRRLAGETGAGARSAGFGVLWFFLLLAPTSSIVPIADVLEEHRVYLASMGVFLAVAVGVERLVAMEPAKRTRVAAASLALVLALLPVATLARNAVWVSNEALWADSAAKSPLKPRPLANLAFELSSRGRFEEALRLDQRALRMACGGEAMARTILEEIAANDLALGRGYDALEALEEDLRLGDRSPKLYTTLAATYLALVDVDRAEQAALAAVASSPDYAKGWAMRSIIAYRRNEKPEALVSAQRAVALDPDMVAARFALGEALHGLGRDREACRVWASIGQSSDPSLSFLRLQAKCDTP